LRVFAEINLIWRQINLIINQLIYDQINLQNLAAI